VKWRSATKELGIRIAMGATSRDIAAIVLRHAVLPALVGMAMGVPAAAASTRLLGSLLYGVTPLDVSSFAAARARSWRSPQSSRRSLPRDECCGWIR
jgi:ABC-type antimicrobial peptide transport system permease subunit